MMKGLSRFSAVAVAGLLLAGIGVGCSGRLTPEQAAALAAEGYYKHLMKGECEQFVEGKAGSEALPALYREQLLTACRQFLAQQKDRHGDLTEVRVNSARKDTLTDYTSVFLQLCFADSTSEEIVVPMVEHEGRWRMK